MEINFKKIKIQLLIIILLEKRSSIAFARNQFSPSQPWRNDWCEI